MIRRIAGSLALIYAAVALTLGCLGRGATHLERGGQAYLAHCAVCHGVGGAGDGPLAASISAEGKIPPATLDGARVASLGRAGVRKAIEKGAHMRPGSPMPLWGPHLGPEWMDRIADYVVAMPSLDEAGREMVDGYLAARSGSPPAGRRVYVTYCSSCHGPHGGGDGFYSSTVASKLEPPRLHGSALATLDDAEISRLVSMGGAHAPDAMTMPGWLYTISPAERQALVGYLRVLATTVDGD